MRVRFEQVTKRYRSHTAVQGIDLEVEPGEWLVLLGPSGCGKTTLLRLVAGLETADAGHIWIGDRLVNDVPPAARDVAMVFQNYALYPHFSVFDNIAFPLRARRLEAAEIDRRVRSVASRVDLQMLLDRRPAELSGGQQQRVALARAIVRQPAVYLMDEPLSNLDAQLRAETRGELKRLQQDLGTTTIYVTHDQTEAMMLGHRVALLRDGVIEQLGRPMELYRRPINTFVARFVGSPPINLWPGVFKSGGTVRVAGMELPIEPSRRAAIEKLSACDVGMRAEDIRLASAPAPGYAEARLLTLEPTGTDTIVTLEREGQRLVARGPADLMVAPGTSLWVSPVADRALFFDATTGTRVG